MRIRLLFTFCLIAILAGTAARPAVLAQAPAAAAYPIEVLPANLQFSGDVATRANCVDPLVCSWFSGVPSGTVILGVDPSSADHVNWGGGSISAALNLLDLYGPTRLTLRLAWPTLPGKGLHSAVKRSGGRILLDGKLLWSQRALYPGLYNDYYANNGTYQVSTTIVVRGTGVHMLEIQADPNTAWDISSIKLTASPTPADILGIGYSPYRDCQMPGSQMLPTPGEVEEDIFRLSNSANAIRTYSSLSANAQVPALAIQYGLAVFPGAWLDYPRKTTAQQDLDEAQGLINLACSNAVRGVIVGNEYILRNSGYAGAYEWLAQRITQVRDGVRAACGKNVSLTTAEIDTAMFTFNGPDATGILAAYRPIIDQLDFVMVHIYPSWSGLPIDGAAQFVVRRYLSIQKLLNQTYPGKNKWLIIGETGWPSGGGPVGQAAGSLANQRRFLLELLPLVEANHVQLLYFDAFDELWKIDEGDGVGQTWGYGYTDRSAKHDFYGIYEPAAEMNGLLSGHHVYLSLVRSAGTAINSAGPVSVPIVEAVRDPLLRKEGAAGTDLSVIDASPQVDAEPADRRSTAVGISPSSVRPFTVYAEWPERPQDRNSTDPQDQKFFIPSGLMGDYEQVAMYGCDRGDPHSGELATRVTYQPGEKGWAGGVWQWPENNWGQSTDTVNLSWANKITFWAKGARGGERVRFFAGGLGADGQPHPDSMIPEASTGMLSLTGQWQQYTLILAGKDLSRVVGGFGWAADRCGNPQGATFFLDDILYDYDPALQPPPPERPFVVYRDAGSALNHYIPSGWMGDLENITLSECDTSSPNSGDTAIRSAFRTDGAKGWVGVVWQFPENNWGAYRSPIDLSWANKITFYAKGAQGGERVRFIAGGLGGKNQPYPDSIQPEATSGWITLSKSWQQYSINLAGKDLSHVTGGFGWVSDHIAAPGGGVFYLDDIQYEYEPGLQPPLTPHPFVIYHDAGDATNHYIPSGWMGDAETQPSFLSETWPGSPHSGTTSVRVNYTRTGGWAGAYWLSPSENWGDQPGGYDLRGAKRVSFWARSDTPGVTVQFFAGGVGYETGLFNEPECSTPIEAFPDTLCPRPSYSAGLTGTWTHYTLSIPASADLIRVVGGFGFTLHQSATFYIDDIQWEFD